MLKRGRLRRRERKQFDELVRVFFELEPFDPEADHDPGPPTRETTPPPADLPWWRRQPPH